jgi:Family of unknown function (DUF6338)
MTADAITAQDAARLLTLVAPGYFAYKGYTYVHPQRERGELPTLVTSVALSLPLVAAAQALADLVHLSTSPSTVQFAALLLVGSVATGYLAARLRTTGVVQTLFETLGHHSDPAPTVLVRTVQRMGEKHAQITVTFKDGRVLAGTPRFATDDVDTFDRELYLDHTRWWRRMEGGWTDPRTHGGVLVRLSEVQSIELEADPK